MRRVSRQPADQPLLAQQAEVGIDPGSEVEVADTGLEVAPDVVEVHRRASMGGSAPGTPCSGVPVPGAIRGPTRRRRTIRRGGVTTQSGTRAVGTRFLPAA